MKIALFQRDPLQGGGAAISTPRPLSQEDRIEIIDSLRGIALLGILLMNIPFFGQPHNMGYNLNVANEYSGPNYYTWWIVNMGFEGTMRAIFTILFGAGSLLLLQRLEKKSGALPGADIYYRRLIWLLIFGIINAFILLWPGDILYSYALCGLFLFPFRNMKPGWLLVFGLVFMGIYCMKETMRLYDGKDMRVKGEKVLALVKKDSTIQLTDEQKADKTKWEGYQERMKVENLKKEAEKEVKEMQKGYFSTMAYFKPINQRIQTKMFYHNYIWDTLCLLFIGMALFKWKVLTGGRSKKFYWLMTLLGYGIGLPLSYFFMRGMIDTNFDRTLWADYYMIDVYQFKRSLIAMGHIGVVMLLYKYNVLVLFQRLMARVGQMAFTNYLSQSIICTTIFYGFGFGLFGKLERYELYYVVAAVWVFQVIFSAIWLKYFQFGPLEWVWRSLTYWKKQPMKRVAVPAEASTVNGQDLRFQLGEQFANEPEISK
jgi:uncharacterized protein